MQAPRRVIVGNFAAALLLTACGAGAEDTAKAPIVVRDADTAASDATGSDAGTDPAATPAAPAPNLEPAPEPEPEPITVPWFGTEVDLLPPWEHDPEAVTADGERTLVLRLPDAGGPDRDVLVLLTVPEEAMPAADLLGRDVAFESGETIAVTAEPAFFSSGGPGVRLTSSSSVVLISDVGVSVSILAEDPGAPLEAQIRTIEDALPEVLALLATVEPPTPPAASVVSAAPPTRRLPVVRTSFGPPFTTDPPVPMLSGVTLSSVQDFPMPGDSCSVNGTEMACGSPEHVAAIGDWALPSRTWSYVIAPGTPIGTVCAEYLALVVASGAAFDEYFPPERQCILEQAHGYLMGYVTAFPASGGKLEARVRDDDPVLRDYGACGTPCPSIEVELRFP